MNKSEIYYMLVYISNPQWGTTERIVFDSMHEALEKQRDVGGGGEIVTLLRVS